MNRPLLLPVLVAAFAACDEEAAPPWDQTEISVQARAFSSTVGPGATTTSSYGDRLGPGDLWADSSTSINAPVKSGAKVTTLPTGAQGPAVLVGSLAVSIDLAGSATVATDLETKLEKWRLTGTQSFLPGFLLTDGTALCGLGNNGATYVSADIQCVVLATGAMQWRKTVPRWLTQTQGQGYGLAGQLAIRGATLFVIGGGTLSAFSLADGTETWSQTATAIHRGLVFVGSDLLVEGATNGCVTGTSCLRALNPATGATVAEYAAQSASFLWTQGGNAFFHTPTSGAVRTAVKYDSATHQFTEDAALAATFSAAGTAPLDLSRSVTLGGVTEVMANGKVMLLGANKMVGSGPPVLCRYTVATRKMDWCQQLTYQPLQMRVHPNVIFLAGQYATHLPPEPGGSSGVTDFRFYFGKWGFNLGDVHADR